MNRRLFLSLPLIASLPAPARLEGAAPDLERYFTGYSAAFVMRSIRTGETLRHNPEGCRKRFSPCSTFKIPNSLIGLETGAIPHPDFVLRWDGTPQPFPERMRDHTLRSAFTNSIVWYYQQLAERVGSGAMESHLNRLRYGNRDTSGGITRFWLQTSLAISPEEQVDFLTRLYRNDLPYSRRAVEIVKDLMYYRETPRGVLRGKTGTGGSAWKQVADLGWYVGWVESGGDAWVFAANLTGGGNPSGRTARGIVEAILADRNLL